MNEYALIVAEKAASNSTDLLPNAGPEHASIAMAALFDKTQYTAKLVVGSFDGNVSNKTKYIQSLDKCIDRGVAFKIIFLEKPNLESKAYNILLSRKKAGKNIEFKEASIDVANRLKNEEDMHVHFAVFDDKMFRLEKDTKKYSAVFCFNDIAISGKLESVFDSLYKQL